MNNIKKLPKELLFLFRDNYEAKMSHAYIIDKVLKNNDIGINDLMDFSDLGRFSKIGGFYSSEEYNNKPDAVKSNFLSSTIPVECSLLEFICYYDAIIKKNEDANKKNWNINSGNKFKLLKELVLHYKMNPHIMNNCKPYKGSSDIFWVSWFYSNPLMLNVFFELGVNPNQSEFSNNECCSFMSNISICGKESLEIALKYGLNPFQSCEISAEGEYLNCFNYLYNSVRLGMKKGIELQQIVDVSEVLFKYIKSLDEVCTDKIINKTYKNYYELVAPHLLAMEEKTEINEKLEENKNNNKLMKKRI